MAGGLPHGTGRSAGGEDSDRQTTFQSEVCVTPQLWREHDDVVAGSFEMHRQTGFRCSGFVLTNAVNLERELNFGLRGSFRRYGIVQSSGSIGNPRLTAIPVMIVLPRLPCHPQVSHTESDRKKLHESMAPLSEERRGDWCDGATELIGIEELVLLTVLSAPV